MQTFRKHRARGFVSNSWPFLFLYSRRAKTGYYCSLGDANVIGDSAARHATQFRPVRRCSVFQFVVCILCPVFIIPFRSSVAVSPFCRCKMPLFCENYVRKFRSVTAVNSKKIRNGSGNGNGVRKRQRLRERRNGNGRTTTEWWKPGISSTILYSDCRVVSCRSM